MNESLNSNRLAAYSSQQRGKSNFVKRIGGVYSIKSVVLRPDFSRISGCVLRLGLGAHTVLGWMMMMPNDRFGSSYLVFSIELSSCQSSWWWVFLVIITGKAITYSLARLYKTCVPITCLALPGNLPPSWWGNVIEKRSFEAVLNLSDCLTNSK